MRLSGKIFITSALLAGFIILLHPRKINAQSAFYRPTLSEVIKQVCGRKGHHLDMLYSIKDAAAKYHIQEEFLVAMIYTESRCKITARSRSGAVGLMQLMPSTARSMGVSNPRSVRQNIMGGAKYLAKMLHRFDGDISLALAAYNAGPTNVRRHRGVPPFGETRQYIKKVLGLYKAIETKSIFG